MKIQTNVLYVGFFTQQGAMADDFILMGQYLAKKCNLFCVLGNSDQKYSVAGAKKTIRLSFNRDNKFSYFNLKNYYILSRFVKENKICLIFFKTPNIVNVMLSIMFRRIPQVEYCHDFCSHSGVNIVMQLLAGCEKKILAQHCAKIFVASKYIKNKMKNCGGLWKTKDITVIPLGILENLVFPLSDLPVDIDILFFGRIEYYKGIDILLKAVEKNVNWRVCIGGKGDIKAIFNINEIPLNVTVFNQYLPDAQISELIQRSKVVVLPYRDATGTQIIPTAMYYGKAIVATDVGCFPDYIEDGVDGLIVPHEDAEKLYEALDLLLTDDKLCNKIEKAALKKAKIKFDNDRISDLYLKEFEEILSLHR